MVSVAGKEYEEDSLARRMLGQGAYDGSPSRPPSRNKDPNVGIGADVEGQSITEGFMRDTTSVKGGLEAQEATLGTERLQQELADEEPEPAPEHHAYGRRASEEPTSDSASIVEEMGGSNTAPIGSASGEILGREILPELVGEQDLELQKQECGSLSRDPTEALDPNMPGITTSDQSATAPDSPRSFKHINQAGLTTQGGANTPASGIDAAIKAIVQDVASSNSLMAGEADDESSGHTALGNVDLGQSLPAIVDATTSEVVSGNKDMEVDLVTSKTPNQSALDLLQTEQKSIAEDADIQATRAETVGALPEGPSSTDHGTTTEELPPQQRPSLSATDGWLRIEIPAHFHAVRNQLKSYKSMEEMQSAPKATGKRSRPNVRTGSARKVAKNKPSHTPGGKAKDSKSGGTISSSSAAIPQETPSKSGAHKGDYYGSASEEEEVMLLTDPMDGSDVELGSQGDGTADEKQESGPPAPREQSFEDLAADSIGDSTNSAAVAVPAEPAVGRVTRSRSRGRGSGRGQRGH